MRFPNPKTLTVLFICVVLASVLGATSLNAQQTTRVSGKMTAAYTQRDSIVVTAATGHIMSLVVSEGKNVNTGEHAFMDGAQAVNMGLSDLVQGNGIHNGYIRFTQNGNSTLAKWDGKVTTTITADGTPLVVFGGTFSYIRGTGQFKNIKGGGSYSGKFTSETEYSVEWLGEYFIEK